MAQGVGIAASVFYVRRNCCRTVLPVHLDSRRVTGRVPINHLPAHLAFGLERENSARAASPKVSEVESNAGALGLKKVAGVLFYRSGMPSWSPETSGGNSKSSLH